MKGYAYYPGCSLKGTARNYEKSLLKVFEKLGINISELDDWNCCGSTLFYSSDKLQAYAFSARNLALAEEEDKDIVAPCSACYHTLKKTLEELNENPSNKEKINKALGEVGLEYEGTVEVKHPLEVLIEDLGLEAIKKEIKKKLDGLRIAPYYGCLFARPHGVGDPHFPDYMDQLLKAIGIEVVDYPVKTRCCGGLQSYIERDAGLELIYILLNEAEKRGAEAIATLCPFCHLNLEIFQEEVQESYDLNHKIPIIYFTQILGFSLGVSEKNLELSKLPVPAESIIRSVQN